MRGGRRCAVASVGLALLFAAPVVAPAAAPAPRAAPVHKLTPPAPPRRVQQGAAVRLPALRRDARYRDTFLREFDSLTPENEMKMQTLQPRRGGFDFAAADELVAFAKEHHKQIRGHALVWGLQLPLWVIDHGLIENLGLRLPPLALPGGGSPIGRGLNDVLTVATGWRRAELLAIMRRHIDTVMRHFGDDVLEWDVVNEPLAETGALADNVWRRFVGDDYVEQALRAAHAANPRAKLYINEYGVEGPGRKLDGLLALVRRLRAGGVPLDGVGLQAHTHIQGFHDAPTIARTMRRFADLGLEVQITEMDVGTSLLDASVEQRLARQAVAYGEAARACNAVRACKRFTTWGFSDRQSWLGPSEMALLFDGQYEPKPAYDAVRSAFAPRSARSTRRPRPVVRPSGRKRVPVRKPARAA